MRALLLPVAAASYAVSLEDAREIVTAPAVTALPTAPPPVLGVFNLRGDLVPLLDTAALLGIGAVGAAPFAVVVQTPLGLGALAVTAVPRLVELAEPAALSETPGGVATYVVDGGGVVLLDVAALLRSDRIARWER